MSYLDEFQFLLQGEKLANFLRLWEEYCMGDEVDGEELKNVLTLIKESILAPTFGQVVETTLPLWNKLDGKPIADDILRLIIDLETTNTPLLADLATDFLKRKYEGQENFSEKMRIVGLRSRHKFQRAISNYELLTHMNKGKFVFHTGGWGVGEVMDISLLREHVLIEFEETAALKDLSFENAFKNLILLTSDHFLARRFGDPDALEKEGREDPLSLIHMLLNDIGPKTAQEIKEELCELVIPEEEWSKWWQSARSKIKKDTKIKSPKSSKEPFVLRKNEVSHATRFKEALQEVKAINPKILLIYNFLRDFPEVLKNAELKADLKPQLEECCIEDENYKELNVARKIQVTFLLEDVFPDEYKNASADLIKPLENIESTLKLIEIAAFKKRVLSTIRETRDDWMTVFSHLLFTIAQNPIRDYLFKELQGDPTSNELLQGKIHDLLHKVTLYPEAFFWYFQKLTTEDEIPYNTAEGRRQFLEALLLLLHFVEDKPSMRELVKKIHNLITSKRYAIFRSMIAQGSVEYLRELLLLASKCQSFDQNAIRTLHSLAEVIQPSLAKKKKDKKGDTDIIWATEEGYQKLQKQIQHIGTVETVDNAKEIEEARAHGDLRENSEYKFALERRSRLQSELQALSTQLNQARILTKYDIHPNEVSIGAVVHLKDTEGNKVSYTILGPFEADPEEFILSFQSKLAQKMIGCKKGDTFDFQDTRYTVESFESYLS
ncbi:MAG: Transcription elongation factor GreA [Chlamydiales bacterium]|nr:Transcription elongation factor GreA [Chlamydiales bacterium]